MRKLPYMQTGSFAGEACGILKRNMKNHRLRRWIFIACETPARNERSLAHLPTLWYNLKKRRR